MACRRANMDTNKAANIASAGMWKQAHMLAHGLFKSTEG